MMAAQMDPVLHDAQALASGHLGDPFALLGPHPAGAVKVVRCYVPGAASVTVLPDEGPSVPLPATRISGFHAGPVSFRHTYRLGIRWEDGNVQETEDPYSFGLLLGDVDIYLIAEGTHRELGRCLGAQYMSYGGVAGVRFALWAPNARRVSVVGDFNAWDGRRHPMRKRVEAGVWELFIPRLPPGTAYKYEILGPHGLLPLKADPVALQAEPPPRTASVVSDPSAYTWGDAKWMAARAERQSLQSPLSIYEVHASSWRKDPEGHEPLSWDALADQLLPYVTGLGFTHIELMPIMAHPFRGSWGYQPLGLFAPDAGHGDPAGFARFVDRCHQADVGVLLDWVPAHFPSDPHGIAHLDGTALYEHQDPREGFHHDWNTLIYNLGRREVQSFLISSALHWLRHYHVDGLRVDAVASMLYRDYSRQAGEWVPNREGGRENLEAVDFVRQLNDAVATEVPSALMIAEESTAWPGVTRSASEGGLGFRYKWNMGWMHDTLHYISRDPVYRSHDHGSLTFGLLYAHSEHFVLPLSHDEVVHGKGSLLGKMPGDRWQKFANLRAYLGFMWTHPGKKLLFMGGEFAQEREWNHDRELDWWLLSDAMHGGMRQLVADLNHVYRAEPALYRRDHDPGGFQWLVGDDRDNSVYAYARWPDGEATPIVAVCNFTPVPRTGYRLGVPLAGAWKELLNTDAAVYGGSNLGNGGRIEAAAEPSHGCAQSLSLTLPPLATLILRPAG